jgi:DNA-binding MarR family transcriptional regulator
MLHTFWILSGEQENPMLHTEPERIQNGRRINELCAAVTRESLRRGQARLAAVQLSVGAYNVLRAMGDRHGMTIADVRKVLRVESATVSTLLLRMERDGLVTKAPSQSDKRATVLKMTEHAARLLKQADQEMALEAADLTHRVSEGDQVQLIALLERVLANLDSKAIS